MGLTNNYGLFFITKPKNIINIIFILIGIISLYLFFNRDYYLPFLGESVIPFVTTKKKESKNIIKTTIKNLPKNGVIIYWAARSNNNGEIKDILDPYTAYGDYSNSGITYANEKGEAIIEYECPVKYKVSKFGIMNKILRRHIHYRYIDPKLPGFLSDVKTFILNKECV
jgi:hypothetical protein